MRTEHLVEEQCKQNRHNNCLFYKKHLTRVIFNHTHNITIYIIFDLNNSTYAYSQLILQMPVALSPWLVHHSLGYSA
jgi:hypothetical protein